MKPDLGAVALDETVPHYTKHLGLVFWCVLV